MTPAPRRSGFGALAIVLLLLGVVLAALSRVAAGSERHSYSSGAVPPASVAVTGGRTYLMSVPGGVGALQAHGLDPAALRCEWSEQGSGAQALDAQFYGTGGKATNAIGSFVAPVSGAIHLDCVGWGAVFVDDADNASGDVAGLLLVLCVLALTFGATLGLSALRGLSATGSVGAAGEDDEIERLVHLVHVRSEDGEVGDGDGRDVVR